MLPVLQSVLNKNNNILKNWQNISSVDIDILSAHKVVSQKWYFCVTCKKTNSDAKNSIMGDIFCLFKQDTKNVGFPWYIVCTHRMLSCMEFFYF
jgi:hypothetical protein